MCGSLAELRAAGLAPAADEAVADDEDARERRAAALAALDEARRADPHRAERKRRRASERREELAPLSRYGGQLDAAKRQLVIAAPRACRHFFGVAESGGGCTRGDNCRLAHRVDGVNARPV